MLRSGNATLLWPALIVILTYLCLLRQKPIMSIWDFFQKPRDQAWHQGPGGLMGKPTLPSFRILKSYILSISWLLFLLTSPSSSNLMSLPQPLGQLAHLPSSGISSSSRAPAGLQQRARQATGWESWWCWWSFQVHQNTVSRIQAVPDRTNPHTRCTPSLPSLQTLLFWEPSLSLSNPAQFLLFNNFILQLVQCLRLPGLPPTSSPHCPVGTSRN